MTSENKDTTYVVSFGENHSMFGNSVMFTDFKRCVYFVCGISLVRCKCYRREGKCKLCSATSNIGSLKKEFDEKGYVLFTLNGANIVINKLATVEDIRTEYDIDDEELYDLFEN